LTAWKARGYVRRESDPADRRRVMLSSVAEQMARIAPMYAGIAQARSAAMNEYDGEQFAAILTLFDRLYEITRVAVARLRNI
jgi:DNA-binding MarR family transcriptional regulator